MRRERESEGNGRKGWSEGTGRKRQAKETTHGGVIGVRERLLALVAVAVEKSP